VRDGRVSHECRPNDIGVEGVMPVVSGEVDQAAEGAHAGGINQGVDPAQPGGRFVNGRLARGRILHVAGDGQAAGAGLLGGVGQSVQPPSQEGHLGPALSQANGDRAAETAGGADNDSIHAKTLLMRRCSVDGMVSVQGVKTGRASQPRTVEVRVCTALSQSTSQVGKRCKTSSSATRPSSRASAAPKQKWMPYPKAK
jgi:hypothetical protein